jgi:hypothetical protein
MGAVGVGVPGLGKGEGECKSQVCNCQQIQKTLPLVFEEKETEPLAWEVKWQVMLRVCKNLLPINFKKLLCTAGIPK